MINFILQDSKKLIIGFSILAWILLLSQQVYYFLGIIISFIVFVYGVSYYFKFAISNINIKISYFLLIILVFYIIFGSIINQSYDLRFYTRFLYFLFNIFTAFGVAYLIGRYQRLNFENFILFISKIFFLYSILNVIAIFSTNFREISLIFFTMDEAHLFLYDQYPYRFFGLAGINGFGVALLYPLLIAGLLTGSNKNKSFTSWAVLLFIFTSIFGPRLSGLMSLAIALIFSTVRLRIYILSLMAISLGFVIGQLSDNQMIRWAFELFISYINDEGIVTESSNRLIEGMYYFPKSLDTILYGDFKYIDLDGLYYGSTDAGYMRMMLYFGVIGSLFFYISFLYFNFSVKRKYFYLFLLIMLIAEFKGDAIMASPASKLYMLFVAYFTVSSNIKIQSN